MSSESAKTCSEPTWNGRRFRGGATIYLSNEYFILCIYVAIIPVGIDDKLNKAR